MPDERSRDHDIVVFGATGFTGELTAAYLAEHAPADLPLGAGRAQPGASSSRCAPGWRRSTPPWPTCRCSTPTAPTTASLRAVAESTRVVITTVGPYLLYGEPLVAACAAAGTDYVDLTGEPEFVDRMYLEHHDEAVASGARIVHACGFDSIPHDLGAWFTVQELGSTEPITLRGVVRAGAHLLRRHLPLRDGRDQPARADARGDEGPPREGGPRRRAGSPARWPASRTATPTLGLWLLPLPTIDPFVVARSGAALASYGPDFRYSHYAGLKTLRYTVGGRGAVPAPWRWRRRSRRCATSSRAGQAGRGPSEERREKSWFTVDFVGESAGRTVHTRVSGGDPGYTETAKMLAESALCLALDDNPQTAGQVTTAHAMAENLLARLQKAGMRFEVL